MSQKFRVRELKIKSSTANRSGLVTENMTSSTPDKLVGTTFKALLVNENGEQVVGNERKTYIGPFINLPPFTTLTDSSPISMSSGGFDYYESPFLFNAPIEPYAAPAGKIRYIEIQFNGFAKSHNIARDCVIGLSAIPVGGGRETHGSVLQFSTTEYFWVPLTSNTLICPLQNINLKGYVSVVSGSHPINSGGYVEFNYPHIQYKLYLA